MKLAPVRPSSTSVPRPSAAKADAVPKLIAPVPEVSVLKVTVSRVERDEKGVGLPPPNEMVPAVLENVGSVVQSEKTDPVFETFTTDSTVRSNVSDASTALTLSPAGSTMMVVVKV